MEPLFYFDFASPNAYLAHKLLPGLEQRTGARFRYIPVLLGGLFKLTGNQAPMTAFAGVPAKLAYERRELERFIERHGLTAFRINPSFPINTLQPMRGAVAAAADGMLMPYIEAVFRLMWEQQRKLDDPEVFEHSLQAAGLPAARLLALSNEPEIKAKLLANTQDAAAHGAFGIPSFLVGEELFFGKDRLADVEHELIARAA